MRYLPDTNILIRAAKGCSPESEFLNKIVKKRQIMISTIVVGEFLAKATDLEEGMFKSLLAELTIIPIDLEVAKVAAVYRRESLKTKRGQMLDCFLAAQAKVHKLTLVTNNKSDFPMKDVKIITP